MKEKKSKLVEIKTKQTDSSVEGFLNNVENEEQRKDSFILLEMMKEATGEKPKIWGTSMIGFGILRYKSPATGREVDWFKIGFSPRKANLSIHLAIDVQKHAGLLEKLGKHKTGVGCLYVKRLSDIDLKILRQLVDAAVRAKGGT